METALALVRDHCDLIDRLRDVPPSARVRGLYFGSVVAEIKRAGKQAEYESYFPGERRSTLGFHPLTDYLVRLAVAGALIESPARVHAGMERITRGNAQAFAASLLGRVLLRMLARDPVRLTEQGLAARRLSTNYGEWRLERRGPCEIEMVYRDEYMWIESAIAGAAAGTFASCRVETTVETVLTDRYHGSTLIRW